MFRELLLIHPIFPTVFYFHYVIGCITRVYRVQRGFGAAETSGKVAVSATVIRLAGFDRSVNALRPFPQAKSILKSLDARSPPKLTIDTPHHTF